MSLEQEKDNYRELNSCKREEARRGPVTTRMVDVTGIEDIFRLRKLLAEPSDCLRDGGLVAFPTETVYGLGADALNETAAGRIYAAKGRPSDNPLIIHIADTEAVNELAYSNERAQMLAEAFWPGPLTIILPKKDIVPYQTTGGLDTVAIRMPAHPAALELIRQSGVYVAAPSANISGRPSPTKAAHVVEDMSGRIGYIVDGGAVGIGIESTIVDLTSEVPAILRPGYITQEMLEQIVGKVVLDPALENPKEGIRPKAPGMKYTHYAPRGELTLVELSDDTRQRFYDRHSRTDDGLLVKEAAVQALQQPVILRICSLADEKRRAGYRVGIMASRETLPAYDGCADAVISVGDRSEFCTVAAGLYAALRDFDAAGVDYIYAESFRDEGLGYAVMNRLLKAAGQRVIYV